MVLGEKDDENGRTQKCERQVAEGKEAGRRSGKKRRTKREGGREGRRAVAGGGTIRRRELR